MKVLRLICFISLQAPVLSVHAADASPGLWSITVSMAAEGADSELAPVTKTRCLTEADARSPDKLFAEMGGGCTFGDKHYQGSRFTFSVRCEGLIPMQGSGEVSFDQDSFEGSLAIQAHVPEMGALKTKSRISGNRLADC